MILTDIDTSSTSKSRTWKTGHTLYQDLLVTAATASCKVFFLLNLFLLFFFFCSRLPFRSWSSAGMFVSAIDPMLHRNTVWKKTKATKVGSRSSMTNHFFKLGLSGEFGPPILNRKQCNCCRLPCNPPQMIAPFFAAASGCYHHRTHLVSMARLGHATVQAGVV